MPAMTQTRAPVPISRAIDPDALCHNNPCDAVRVLGSFWPHSRNSFESHIVKGFKECVPVTAFEPGISALCEFYAELMIGTVGGFKFDSVVRVLSSSEKEPEAHRPQSLLADAVCRRTGARNFTHLFFKSESRPPMRTVEHLSGSEALKNRIRYAAQDLFIKPFDLGGTVMLIDDIMNTGASARVYAHALKSFAGVERVVAVNLAATRFKRGKDGYGMLSLDLSRLCDHGALSPAWVDSAGVFHQGPDCRFIEGSTSPELQFIAERKSSPCPVCHASPTQPRKWWQVFSK